WCSLQVVDPKALICDEEHRGIGLRAGAVLHDLAFWKPDKCPRTIRPLVRHELTAQDIQAMAAGMRMSGVHKPRWVADQADFRAGLRVSVQILAQDRLAELLVVPLFPWLRVGVDREKFTVRHVLS